MVCLFSALEVGIEGLLLLWMALAHRKHLVHALKPVQHYTHSRSILLICVLCGQLYLIICYLFKQAINYDVIWPLFFDRWIPWVRLQRVFFNLLMTTGWMPLKKTGWEHGGLRNYCVMSWCLRRSRLFLVKMLGECFLEVLHCLGIHNVHQYLLWVWILASGKIIYEIEGVGTDWDHGLCSIMYSWELVLFNF